MKRRFSQVDVFTAEPFLGNPLAVVLDAEDLSADDMQTIANWTNLSETTFLVPPTDAGADYRVRIFTPTSELPFAGHPTLGTCRVWLDNGGAPRTEATVVQQCGAGLVPLRIDGDDLAFRAPPLIRSGPVDEAYLARVLDQLGIERSAVVDSAWIDNGPGWVGILMASAQEVLAVRPGALDHDLHVGLIGPHPEGSEPWNDGVRFELRAFSGQLGSSSVEDPVTGSLNASAGQWMIGSGRATAPYRTVQGTAIGRAGRISISTDDDGEVWVGGRICTVITGHLEA